MPDLILIFIYIIELLLAAFYLVRKQDNNRFDDIYKSTDIFLIFFILIHVFMPLLQELVDFFRYQEGYHIQTSLVTNIAAIVSLLTILILVDITRLKNYKQNNLKDTREIRPYSLGLVSVFALVGLVASITNFKNILSFGWARYFADRIAFGEGKGILLLFAHHIYMIALFLFIRWYKKRTKRLLFLYSAFTIWVLAYYTVTGNRNSIFIYLISLIILWFILSRKPIQLKPFRLFITSTILVFAFIIGGMMREGTDDNLDTSRAIIWGLNGAFGNHENVQWLYEHNYKLLLGETYVAGFLNFIPRKFWKNKPFGAGPKLKNMIHPGTYIYGTPGNSSLTTGLVTEAIMNFGFIFYIIPIIIWAFLLSGIFYLSRFIRTDLDILIYVYTFVFFSFIIIYAEFMGFLSRYLFLIFPYFVISILDRLKLKKL